MTPIDFLATSHVTLLFWWGVANAVLSAGILPFSRGAWRGAWAVNLLWNLFTLVTWAVIQLRFPGPGGNLEATEAMLLFLCGSIGLDIAMYGLGGAWILSTGRRRQSPFWWGAAWSFWFQGIVHLTNSFAWLAAWLNLRWGLS
jgi:hypothetical protein